MRKVLILLALPLALSLASCKTIFQNDCGCPKFGKREVPQQDVSAMKEAPKQQEASSL